MNPSFRRLAAVAAALALLGLGWALGRHPPLAPAAAIGGLERSGTVAAAPTTAADLVPGEPAAVVAPAAGTAPVSAAAPAPVTMLPPADTPIAEVFDDLLARARSGDAHAACRLASELERCRGADHGARQSARMEDWAARVDSERRREAIISHIARVQEELQRAATVCAGLDKRHYQHAFALQLQAASRLPSLRVWAASNPALDTIAFIDELEHWAEYRRTVLPWLRQAADEGDLAALIVLARIHGDDRRHGPPYPPFRQIDDAAFVRYASLLERRGVEIPPVQRALEAARGRLDPATLAGVQAEVDALAARQPAAAPDEAAQREALRRSYSDTIDAVDCSADR
jgi:hypothetical protein